MNDTVIVAASTGTWISVCFSFFQNVSWQEISQDWVFLSKEKIKWHQCCLVDSWPVACSKTPDCLYLVSGFFVFSCFVFGEHSLYASGQNSSLNTTGCWIFQNLKNMLFCILDNDAVVVQKWPTKVLWGFFILHTRTHLVNNVRCKHANWNKALQPLELCSYFLMLRGAEMKQPSIKINCFLSLCYVAWPCQSSLWRGFVWVTWRDALTGDVCFCLELALVWNKNLPHGIKLLSPKFLLGPSL